ncbi:MAG TPA: ABC transporter ATP-binding protein [Candidatus Limnocylindrales bacterium]
MTLSLRGVRYRYAGSSRAVLDGIDLDVAAGEVLGIAGPSEAGKSTLCLVAAGLAPSAIGGRLEGSVWLDDRDTASLRPHEAAERCGIVFQNPTTQLSATTATVWEEVAFGPRNLGLSVGEIVERVDWALSTVSISHLAARNPEHLSGGQAQLVALASVLALRPRTLVLDEPTSLLDPAGTRLVGDVLATLARETRTAVVVVEHKTDLLARLATRIAVIDAGRIVLDGPPDRVLADPALPAHGVEPPAAVAIRRAAEAAGLGDRLASVDLEALTASRPDAAADRAAPAASPRPPAQPAAGGEAAIETADLGFVYPAGTEALRSVDLAVRTGERIALIGQNGSGKSTLVRHFNGLLRPSRGSVRVNGQPVGRRHVADLSREVGLAFQDPDRQVFARRVDDEVAFGARNLGVRGDELRAAVDRALSAVGLHEELATNPFDLGFSRRKLLAIASVLVMDDPIVVLDEPTTGQDARGAARIAEVVDGLHAAGRTVIAISHDMRFVAEQFDRVVVMRNGGIALDAAAGAAFDESQWAILASTYLEPPLAARVGARLELGSTPTTGALLAALAATFGSSDPR